MNILVTGATGFIGQSLISRLQEYDHVVHAAVRRANGFNNEFVTGDIGPETSWSSVLRGCTAVVHLASRVHVMQDSARNSLAENRYVNTYGTINLARQAAAAGVGRFVFTSTIKVNGERTESTPFRHDDIPSPGDPYSISKWEAECALHEISINTGMELVVVRPPLVYGPGVKGNLLRLLRLIKSGLPLPFGACNNKRSLVGLDNITDLLLHCLSKPEAAGQTLLVSDGEDLSTPELVRRLARSLNQSPKLVAVPPAWLEVAAKLISKPELYDRLCGSLQLDIQHTRQVLHWTPPVSVDEGLLRTASWYLNQGSVAR